MKNFQIREEGTGQKIQFSFNNGTKPHEGALEKTPFLMGKFTIKITLTYVFETHTLDKLIYF